MRKLVDDDKEAKRFLLLAGVAENAMGSVDSFGSRAPCRRQAKLGVDDLLFSRHGVLQCAEAGRFATPTARNGGQRAELTCFETVERVHCRRQRQDREGNQGCKREASLPGAARQAHDAPLPRGRPRSRWH